MSSMLNSLTASAGAPPVTAATAASAAAVAAAAAAAAAASGADTVLPAVVLVMPFSAGDFPATMPAARAATDPRELALLVGTALAAAAAAAAAAASARAAAATAAAFALSSFLPLPRPDPGTPPPTMAMAAAATAAAAAAAADALLLWEPPSPCEARASRSATGGKGGVLRFSSQLAFAKSAPEMGGSWKLPSPSTSPGVGVAARSMAHGSGVPDRPSKGGSPSGPVLAVCAAASCASSSGMPAGSAGFCGVGCEGEEG